MKNVVKTTTGRCHSCGKYYFRTYKTRPPKMCSDCAEYTKRENTKLRQRAFRARRKAKEKGASKQPSEPSPRLVPVGARASVAREDQQPPTGGLFAGTPEPERTTNRKALGLP